MIIKVRMTAFMDGQIRQVSIPDDTSPNAILQATFYHGQNDVNPQNLCSVSAGDIIEYDNKLFLVTMRGFKEVDEDFYKMLIKQKPEERIMFYF